MKKLLVVVVLGTLLVAGGYAVTGAWTQKGSLGAAANKPDKLVPCCPQPLDASDGVPVAVTAAKLVDARTATTQPAEREATDGALAAMQRAADAKKYLFLFVYDQDNEPTREARKKFDAAIEKLGSTVQWATVNRTAPSERGFIEQLELKTVPTPFVLALAPNGAITGGFLGANLTEQKLVDSVVSPAQQACMKALQERKLVLLCAQNGTTKANDLAMKGVDEFKADARFIQATEIVKIDPADGAEKKFLGQLQLASNPDQATTFLLAPPGAILAKIPGATTKDALVAALQKASAGCSGASGCCPPKK